MNQLVLNETEKYRTGSKRLWAAVVDAVVFLPLLLMEQWLFSMTDNYAVLILCKIVVEFSPIVYSVVLHHKCGQTIGKWVAGVKVVDIGEARGITLRQSLLRDSFYLLSGLTGLFFFFLLIISGADAERVLMTYGDFSVIPAWIWIVMELVSMLTNRKQRAIHDFLARTVVIQVKQR